MVNDKDLGNIVMGFVLIVIGIALLGVIADSISANVTLTSNTNESITITSETNTVDEENITLTSGVGQTGNTSLKTFTFFGNETHNTSQPGITLGIEVNFTRAGVISANFTDGTYQVDYTYSTNSSGASANVDITSVSYFGNGSINTDLADISFNTDVNWTTGGAITVDSINFTDVTYDFSYTYEGSEYVSDSTSRVLLLLVTLFFSIAVMLLGFVMVKNGFEGMGIIGK